MTYLEVLGIEKGIKNSGFNMGKKYSNLILANCNLKCKGCRKYISGLFFTRHTIGTKLKFREIYDALEVLDCNSLLITGGEPLLQRISLYRFLILASAMFNKIGIETNGTLAPTYLENFIDFWDISLKLGSSKNKKTQRERPLILRKYYTQMDNAYFVFDIRSNKDLYDFINLQKKYNFNNERVIMMCQNAEMKDNIFEMCKKNGFTYQVPLKTVIR